MLDIQLTASEKNNLSGNERWIGMIASEESWKENIPGYPLKSKRELKGWGERYRVRILGHNDSIRDEKQLPWASVLYPVNAGGGPGGQYSPASMAEGTIVMGIWADGLSKQQPLIIGVLGYNQFVETEISSTDFVPRQGFSTYDQPSIYLETTNTETTTSSTGGSGQRTEGQEKNAKENKVPINVAKTCSGESMNANSIQSKLINGIQKIQALDSWATKKHDGFKKWGKSKTKEVDDALQKISDDMKGDVGKAFESLEDGILGTLTSAGDQVKKQLFPNQQEKLKKQIEKSSDLVSCLITSLMGTISNSIFKILKSMIKKLINITQCVVETILATILGHFTALIKNAMATAIGAITAITGGLVKLTSSIGRLLSRVLSFLTCDVKPECIDQKEWDTLVGKGDDKKFDVMSIIKAANEVSSAFTDGFDSVKDMTQSLTSGKPISDAFDNAAKCYSGPRHCGPPEIRIFGGSGMGAVGNAVINALDGEVLGIDITQFGVNYNEKPFTIVFDDCGKGSGAVIEPVIGEIDVVERPDGTWEDDQGRPIKDGDKFITGIKDIHGNLIRGEGKTLGVKSINVLYSGRGYLSAPDGSLGGDGRTWASPTDTIVHRDDGWDTPTPGGNVIEVDAGDNVTIPHGTTTNAISSVDGPDQMLMGGVPTTIDGPSRFTSPTTTYEDARGSYPSASTGAYPVVLYLCDILVERRGYRYSPGDKVVITPNHGAEVEVTFDEYLGQIDDVKVTKGGEGFQEMPFIYIQSETGVGAELIPKFCIDRIGEDEAKSPDVQDKIVSVVDCVGAVTRGAVVI